MGFLTNFRKPWLKRNYNKKQFIMKPSYIVKHLEYGRDKVDFLRSFVGKKPWRDKKVKVIIEQLRAGKNPLSFQPMRLLLHRFKEEFRVDDGLSKLIAFREEEKRLIRVEIRVGEW